MGIFFSYIFLGLSLAAPIGPINAAQLDKALKFGFLHSWFVGLGAILADGIYMLVVYLGVVQFLDTPFMQTLLWSFGCFVLIYTGIESMVSAGNVQVTTKKNNASLSKSFFSGFFMSISNPLTILFWLGIYGSILAKTISENDNMHIALYSFAIFLGLLLWDVTMALTASSFKKFVAGKLLVAISFISGLSLIGFGLYFGIQAIKLMFF